MIDTNKSCTNKWSFVLKIQYFVILKLYFMYFIM